MPKTVEKEKHSWFFLIKVDLNMRNKKYSSKKNFVNRRALQFVPFMMIYDTSALSKTGLERERDFHTGKIYFSIFRRTKVISNTLRLRPIHGNSLKEISFWTEMHRSARERLRLKCPGTRTSWCFLWRHWNPFCLKITDWRMVNL